VTCEFSSRTRKSRFIITGSGRLALLSVRAVINLRLSTLVKALVWLIALVWISVGLFLALSWYA
jgi:hypothetical protein